MHLRCCPDPCHDGRVHEPVGGLGVAAGEQQPGVPLGGGEGGVVAGGVLEGEKVRLSFTNSLVILLV